MFELNRDQNDCRLTAYSAELAIAWITEIVAVILGYLCKAYFETKQAEQVRLQEKKMTEEAKG